MKSYMHKRWRAGLALLAYLLMPHPYILCAVVYKSAESPGAAKHGAFHGVWGVKNTDYMVSVNNFRVTSMALSDLLEKTLFRDNLQSVYG